MKRSNASENGLGFRRRVRRSSQVGTNFVPIWEDRRTLRLVPNPFSGTFDLSIPYLSVGKKVRPLGSGRLEVRVVTL